MPERAPRALPISQGWLHLSSLKGAGGHDRPFPLEISTGLRGRRVEIAVPSDIPIITYKNSSQGWKVSSVYSRRPDKSVPVAIRYPAVTPDSRPHSITSIV